MMPRPTSAWETHSQERCDRKASAQLENYSNTSDSKTHWFVISDHRYKTRSLGGGTCSKLLWWIVGSLLEILRMTLRSEHRRTGEPLNWRHVRRASRDFFRNPLVIISGSDGRIEVPSCLLSVVLKFLRRVGSLGLEHVQGVLL